MNAPLNFDELRRAHPLPDVAAAAGLKLERAGREYKACCPFHPDRTPSFTIYPGRTGLRWCCQAGCGEGDVLDFLCKLHGVGLRDAADMLTGGNLPAVHVAPLPAEGRSDRLDEARSIWRSASPIQGTLAENYLRSRGLRLIIPASLRFARLRYGSGGPLHPCLIAAVASVDHKLIGIQRTYLNASGTGKAAVPKAKLSLGSISGGAIRLAPCARSMVVCEGLEDGLTLMQEMGAAVWVGAGAGNLPKMQFPFGVTSIAIGGDADAPGEVAARKAAEAFAMKGHRARVFFPIDAKDFNAKLMGRAQP